MAAMRIVQAVFGVFHHFELAHQLHRRGHLRRIYSTWPWARLQREALPRELVGTFPLLHTTEYLLKRSHAAPAAVITQLAAWNARSFDAWTHRQIPPCDAFIAISGAGLLTGRKVQERGGIFVCDRGSTHQRFQEQTLLAEYRRWKLPDPPPKPHITRREEEIYTVADAITVPSTVAKRSFAQMGVPEAKVHVIPYGVRLDHFRPAGERPTGHFSDRFDVLFAGSVSLRKGVPYLLESFARLRHPRKRLTLVGAIQPELRSLLARLPQEHVDFAGALPQPELARRMSRSHVLVLPSVEEGLALVQGQAMACGCPVIATTATGAEDLFTDGVEGYIVGVEGNTVGERDSDALVAALADRMQRLADAPELQEAMRERALVRVQQLGGWDLYGECWERLLYRLTGGQRDGEGALPQEAEVQEGGVAERARAVAYSEAARSE
jgi:glycosyltransferase involved in cell wall biosynthesis